MQKANLRDVQPMRALLKSTPGIALFELVPVADYDEAGGAFQHLIPSRGDVLEVTRELDLAIAAAADAEERAFCVYSCCPITQTRHVMGNVRDERFGRIWRRSAADRPAAPPQWWRPAESLKGLPKLRCTDPS